MSSLAVSGIIFACVFAGALIGLLIRTRLPEHHLSPESKDLVKLVIGVIGTMTALVLGLLVASAKSSYDAQRSGVSQLAANVIMLDRALALYGKQTQGTPEGQKAQEVRELLQSSLADLLRRTWPEENTADQRGASAGTEGRYEEVLERVLALEPKSESQKTLHAQAVRVCIDTGQMRSNLAAQRQASSIPTALLVVMVLWLALILASFGLLAPRNATTILSLALCALVVSSSLYLVLELDHPFHGMIQISSQPLRAALEQLGR
jgi:ABC-type amino acid transport system permease subunit